MSQNLGENIGVRYSADVTPCNTMKEKNTEKNKRQKKPTLTSIARKCKHFSGCAQSGESKWAYWLSIDSENGCECSKEQIQFCYNRYQKIKEQTAERVRRFRAKREREISSIKWEEQWTWHKEMCDTCNYQIWYHRNLFQYKAKHLIDDIVRPVLRMMIKIPEKRRANEI